MDGPERLRIVHILAPAAIGGAERVVQALATGLAPRHEVRVVAVVTPGHPAGRLFLGPMESSDVQTTELSVGARGYLREARLLSTLLRQCRPHVVHTHGYRSDVVAGWVARREGIATVTTVHGFVRGRGRARIYEYLQRRVFRHFDAVVTVSRPLKKELVAAGVQAGRVHLIQNAYAGDPPRLLRDEARTLLGVPSGAFHVGWVGRLSPEKDAALLLRALEKLGDGSVHATLIGDGPEREALERLAQESGLGEAVRFPGAVHAASALFPSFDVFALTSRTEGTPMVLFEAMAAGVPIVATRVGGVPDVVDEVGWLVPPDDPAALARALETVRASPDTVATRVRQASERLRLRFSREEWQQRYETLYRSLLRVRAS